MTRSVMRYIKFARVAAVAVVGLVTVEACGAEEAGGAGGPGGRGAPPPMPVDVAIAARDTVIDEIVATGGIEADQAIELRPEVDGRIVRIFVREGTEVRRGQALFKIDDAELRAQVARLEAQRDLARQALVRTRALFEQDAASQAELETAEAQARTAEADLALQQLRFERTVVRAPFGGVMGSRQVSLGDYVTPATPLVSLQTVDPQRASFEVPERYAGDLALGQRVTFEVASVPGRTFVGEVDFVDPRVELPGRTIRVKAHVPNPDRSLRSGMFIEVRLATEVRPDAVIVPEQAIVQLERGTFVWVIGSGGQALRREIELGVRRPGWAEILSGVEAGETVIIAGMERLFEGASVFPRQPVDAGASAAGDPPFEAGPAAAEPAPGSERPSVPESVPPPADSSAAPEG